MLMYSLRGTADAEINVSSAEDRESNEVYGFELGWGSGIATKLTLHWLHLLVGILPF